MNDTPHAASGLARLARLANERQLPAVTSATDSSPPSLAVDGTPFIQMHDAATALLHCPVDQKVLLMEISPEIYFETDDMIGENAMLIRLDRIDDEELSLRLHDAWTYRAPSHLQP
ncbi:hypothetical protein [Devosia chinhatensis]|uniref:Uncharacterized protein n=1 Tax=Devosia chinhatensis TaxID=429727 RepID=A0A0F5FLE5_9HYPH|nr:hypothetical protein [Devosia chinhatensis]KKB09719.1 hypothetical protein VE26_07610 [Devosia chinhatensis]